MEGFIGRVETVFALDVPAALERDPLWVDLGYGMALDCQDSAFTGESVSGRWNPGHTDAVPAQASWVGDVASWVPAELSGSESRAPDLSKNGCLSIGPYEGV